MLADTHSHIYTADFADDRDTVIGNAIAAGVGMIFMPNIDAASAAGLLATAEKYPAVCFPLMGLHPSSVDAGYIRELDAIFEMFTRNRFYGVGETGIDLYWNTTWAREQEEAFRQQVRFARRIKLPVIIHVRNSFREVWSVIEKEQDGTLTGIFHCFSGTAEEAAIITAAGFYLGIGGVVTYRNSRLAEVLEQTGPEKLVLETDAPWLSPVPRRGMRNESSYLVYTAAKVAEVFGMNPVDVAALTTANALKVFPVEKNSAIP